MKFILEMRIKDIICRNCTERKSENCECHLTEEVSKLLEGYEIVSK